ncbi:MAG: hypothetical protein AB7P21_28150 [Lautropia sp.]
MSRDASPQGSIAETAPAGTGTGASTKLRQCKLPSNYELPRTKIHESIHLEATRLGGQLLQANIIIFDADILSVRL